MRRRRNRQANASEYVQNELKGKVAGLMHNRHRLVAKFPTDVAEVYRLLWSDNELAALAVLKERAGLLRARSNIYVRGVPMGNDQTATVEVTLPEANPMPQEANLPFDHMPEAMRHEIAEWAPVWRMYQLQTIELEQKVSAVGRACSTYGQVFRIWPDLRGFFGDVGRAKINQAAVQSRLPDDVLEWSTPYGDAKRVLKAEFRPEAFEKYEMWIAEALMLPEIEGNHVAKVTLDN